MLNKRICKFCGSSPPEENWAEEDEISWQDNKVWCPLVSGHEIDIREPPPATCPKRLEHAMSEAYREGEALQALAVKDEHGFH